MKLSPQAWYILEAEGWDERSVRVRRYRPKTLKRRARFARTKIGFVPPEFLCQRMSVRVITEAWERAGFFGFHPRRGPGSPYESYDARLIAGAILSDRQLQWLAKVHNHRPKHALWGCLAYYRRRRITWKALRSAWCFGFPRSKRHQHLAQFNGLTFLTRLFARDPRSKHIPTEEFWDIVRMTQIVELEQPDSLDWGEMIERAYKRDLSPWIDPIRLLAGISF